MKRILSQLLLLACFAPMQAEDTSYHPIAKEGKIWNCKGITNSDVCPYVAYSFVVRGDTTIQGRDYKKLYMRKSNFTMYVAALRDEGPRAYIVLLGHDQEKMFYNLDLEKVGSEDNYAYGGLVKIYKSPDIIETDSIPLKHLRWTVSYGDLMPTCLFEWIEGVGTPYERFTPGDFASFYPDDGVITSCYEDNRCLYHNGEDVQAESVTRIPMNRELKAGGNPELSAGRVWLEYTDKQQWTIYIEEAKARYAVRFFKSDSTLVLGDSTSSMKGNIFYERFGLSRGNNKLVLENENEIYTAYFTWPYEEMPYRPFIEEGKVWKVGWFPGGINTAMQLDSYFFYGDTVIDNRTCKQMWCRHQYSKEWPSFANARPSTEYVGALYEEGRRVYCTFPGKEQSELLYDFASAVGDTLDIHDESCIVGDKGTLQTETFKGNYTGVVPLTSIYSEESPLIVWYEGLGLSYAAPLSNTLECGFVGNLFIPLSCTAGDEVIYKNSDPYLELAEDLKPEVETTDGAHSYDVKKQQIDFTHTVKTRPKAPQRTTAQDAEEEVTFSGEYSNIELFLNFLPLVGPYTVTLTNEANGKEVYRKEVQTSNTLALQTALLYYSKGTYTLTVENDEEAYTATLHIEDGSGIERPTPDPSRQGGEGASADNPTSGGLRGAFDLSGRQIVNGKPVNGIYIRGGRKIVVSHSPTLLNPSVIP